MSDSHLMRLVAMGENSNMQRTKVSYKDVCMHFNGGGQDMGEPEEECIADEEDKIEEMEEETNKENPGDSFLPVVKDTREEIREAYTLNVMWVPSGEMEIIDLENGYFLIRFEDRTNVNRVFEGGPWMMLGHHLVVQRWQPKLFLKEDELKRVQVPGLPIEYYDKNILWRIVNYIT
ncbi:hypothetical protein TSUD_368490 [Trifolium subterraneum]|uniref:DUF4283 domain-containing protein n=1 Tax=Trifolium subterraneum TaxID=3900 RepID=A0A2Z6M4J7_TRISU|nr:hypothetical protein TSUD_368490 [Trifolium subterraneum]